MTDLPEKWKWRPVAVDAPLPTPEWLTARIEASLSLYYRPDVSDEVDLLAHQLWLDVLSDLPQDALEQAFGEWERKQTHRPSPAHIRELAERRIETLDQAPRAEDYPFGPNVITADELEHRRRIAAEMAEWHPMLNQEADQ